MLRNKFNPTEVFFLFFFFWKPLNFTARCVCVPPFLILRETFDGFFFFFFFGVQRDKVNARCIRNLSNIIITCFQAKRNRPEN